jgi:hypothetical protein
MPSAYQKSDPAGKAFIPGLTPGVFSLERDKATKAATSPNSTAIPASKFVIQYSTFDIS